MQARLARPSLAPGGIWGGAAFGALMLAIAWFYTWVPASYHPKWFTNRAEGHYNELAAAFLAGRPSLLIEPDPRLVALPDPYDPAQNAAYRVNDLSYFKGRYYVYMGPAPALTVFIPFRLLTGRYLTQESACSLLCITGAGASVALLLVLRRRCLPGTPATVFLSAILALVLADGYYVAARGTIAQQVAIANAYAFGMLGLWACGRAVTAAERPRRWFVAASLFLGIAIASRPNYVFASASLIPPFLYWLRTGGKRAPGDAWKTAAAAALPLGAVVALLLVYNEIRFGHFLEFGQRYQLGGWNQLKLSSTGLAHGWENAWRYLLAPAYYSPYFPFVAAPTWIAVSVLRHVPWLWLTPVAGWALLRRDAPGPVRSLGLSALVMAVTNLLTLVFLPSGNPAAVLTSANARYLLDFQPGLALFVALGVIAAFEPHGLNSRFTRAAWGSLVATLCLASIAVALSLDIGVFPSESHRRLSHLLDLPGYALERARGRSYGPVGVDLIFPRDKTGAYEPLVSTATQASSDLLFINYASPTQVRFGFVSTDGRGPLSNPVTVDFGKSHHLEISMGSLYPPDGHPSWMSLGEQEEAFLSRRLLVELDGRRVFDVQAHFESAPPERVSVGSAPILRGYSSLSFTGEILSVRRLPITPPPADAYSGAHYGAVLMRVRFPAQPAPNAREPLVTTGVPRAGDIVYVQYLSGGRVAFGIDHWGSAGFETGPLAVDAGVEHTVGISIGSLFPAAEHDANRQRARVELDGLAVIDREQDTFDSSPYDTTIGTNAIGGSTCASAFTGQIVAVHRETGVTGQGR
jgi:hypothetical protein